MKYYIVALCLVVIALIGLGVYIFNSYESIVDKDNIASSTAVLVEVIKENVFSEDNKFVRSGDTLIIGKEIKTDFTGIAKLHFPDASTVFVNQSSSLIITAHEFNNENKGVIVKILLISGKVWSQVVNLTMPESTWEVKTANTVIVVRGTAFGISYVDNKTSVVVREGSVIVFIIDPKTQQPISGSEIEVTAGKSIDIEEKDVRAGISPVVKDAPSESLQEIPELKSSPEIQKKSESLIPVRQQEAGIVSLTTSQKRVEKLVLETKNNFEGVKENDHIILEAVAVLSDGSRSIKTAIVEWRVLGPIGIIEKSGVFLAKLGPEVTEFGTGSGAIVAILKDSSGKEITGQTPIFQVDALIPDQNQIRSEG